MTSHRLTLRAGAAAVLALAAGGCSSSKAAPPTPGIEAGPRPDWSKIPLEKSGQWRVVHTQELGEGGELNDVAATGANDAWAGGDSGSAGGVLLRWDGKGWADVSDAAKPKGPIDVLTARGPRDVWSFGMADTAIAAGHWNGSAWTYSSVPSRSSEPVLSDGVAAGDKDVWLAGDFDDSSKGAVKRWDGTRWRDVTTPADICVLAPTERDFMFGAACDSKQGQPRIMRWNTQQWQIARTPAIPLPSVNSATPRAKVEAMLIDIVGVSSAEAWAVAVVQSNGESDPVNYKTYLLRFSGDDWQHIDTGISHGEPARVAPDGQGGAWIAFLGERNVLHYSGGRWTRAELPRQTGNGVADVEGMVRVPGSTRVLAVATQRSPADGGPTKGIIYSFQP